MSEDYVPKGFRKIEAYTNGKEIVAIEAPAEDDEAHDCDALGCSSIWEHVKYRVQIPDWQAAQKQPAPEHRAEGRAQQ